MLRITYTKVPRSVRIPSRATVYEARDVIVFSYYFKQLAITFCIPTLLFRNFIRAKKVLLMHTAAIFASILACNCIFRRHASSAILSSCVTVGWFEGGSLCVSHKGSPIQSSSALDVFIFPNIPFHRRFIEIQLPLPLKCPSKALHNVRTWSNMACQCGFRKISIYYLHSFSIQLKVIINLDDLSKPNLKRKNDAIMKI